MPTAGPCRPRSSNLLPILEKFLGVPSFRLFESPFVSLWNAFTASLSSLVVDDPFFLSFFESGKTAEVQNPLPGRFSLIIISQNLNCCLLLKFQITIQDDNINERTTSVLVEAHASF